jgi:2-methylcitrate dehydratase PrpD
LSRHGVGPGRVTIVMKNGEKYTEQVDHCLGSVENPMSFDDCAKKFRECAKTSIKPLKEDQINRVIGMVDKLDKLDDVSEVIRLL